MIREGAPAKLNLSLRVVGRRADGYHLLDSIVAFTALRDELTAEPAETLSLSVEGPFAPALRAALRADGREDLVLCAARRLAEAAGMRSGARLRLVKNLPVAGGIGGGSADAAAAARALARLWSLDLTEDDLAALLLPLGADIPVCLRARPTLMQGIGDVLLPLPPLPPAGVLLVNPGTPTPTAAVFARRRGAFSPAGSPGPADLAALRSASDLARLLAPLGNDLEEAATGLVPAIAEVLAALAGAPGCLLARLSGSGATCFGLFADEAAAAAAAGTLAGSGWWLAPTRLAESVTAAEGVEAPPPKP